MQPEDKLDYTTYFNHFLELEDSMELGSFEVGGVKLWEFSRISVFFRLAGCIGVFKVESGAKSGIKKSFKYIRSLLFNALFNNPLILTQKHENIVIGSGRKARLSDHVFDMYMYPFLELERFKKFLFVEKTGKIPPKVNSNQSTRHLAIRDLRIIWAKRFSRFNFDPVELHRINGVNRAFEERFGVDLKLADQLRTDFITFKSCLSFYKALLLKLKPKQLYFVCSYNYNMAMIAVAKQLKIRTTELQHGVINPYHIGYNYAKSMTPSYFPDEVFLFGQYWKDINKLPLDYEQQKVYGFPFMDMVRKQYSHLPRHENQILIVSQPPIGVELSKQIASEIDQLGEGYRIIYKLHPSEYHGWKERYPAIHALREKGRIEIIDDTNQSIYELYKTSAIVLGVSSTSLYEALSFGCHVFVLKISSYEYLNALIENGNAKLIEHLSEIKTYNKDKLIPVDGNYFYHISDKKL